jgi:ATP-dependent Clp protease ATP-binding subunit ClpA
VLDRFVGDARRAVREAHDEARALDAPAVGAEHMLLALASRCAWFGISRPHVRKVLEDERRDTLAQIGVSLDALRQGIADDEWERAAPDDALPFTSEAKHVLAASLRLALEFGQRRVTGMHVLIALMRESERARDVLRRAGADPEAVEGSLVSELVGLLSAAGR